MLEDIELRDLRVFLALAEELHFGRTAERLGVSQSVVSQTIRLMERRLDTKLFERTSRRVKLTPAGADLHHTLIPIIDSLAHALRDVRDESNGVSGLLRLAATMTTLGPPVYLLADVFQSRHPRCHVQLDTTDILDPFTCLRRGQVDVVVNWLTVDEPDLTAGPPIAHYDRAVVVGPHHRLATRQSVSVEDLADEVVGHPAPALPVSIADAILPLRTPGGKPLRRAPIGDGSVTHWATGAHSAAIARGEVVHLIVASQAVPYGVLGLMVIPVPDLPPLPLGLIWRTATEDVKVRALAEVARSAGPWPTDAPV